MRNKCTILIADDPGIMRDGLCGLLMTDPELALTGVASSVIEAVRALELGVPDVLIVEIGPATTLGAESIALAKQRWPLLRVLVLTFRKEDASIEAALRAGADGYLLKSDNRAELFTAIHTVASGKPYLSPAVYERVVNGFVNPKGGPGRERPATNRLTQREREVIKLIAAGRRTREIADELALSHKTIEKHRTNLMRKLGLKTATAVAAYAIANGYHTL